MGSEERIIAHLKRVSDRLKKYAAEHGRSVGLKVEEMELIEERRKLVRDLNGFWVKAMIRDETLSGQFSTKDIEVLKHLVDIRTEEKQADQEFTIVFVFNENPFFSNPQICKKVTAHRSDGFVRVEPAAISWYENKHSTLAEDQMNDAFRECFSFFEWLESKEDLMGIALHIRGEFLSSAVDLFLSEVSGDDLFETETQTEDQDEESTLLSSDDEY
ncbi:hypothetical protein NDN08_003738 [Rhodosorus marinus]|uniref:Nucleosome assembly protein n=1 Tax=Rhodosorus marinus TaxID=101924 RepID=A0AAV8V248_9RHOD|nr:hypothetical protein NDN08_003738 [Rhodosorus marinus]